MTIFIFILLLPLAAISTEKSELQISITNVTTAAEVTQSIQPETQQPSTSAHLSKTPALTTTATTGVDRNSPEDTIGSTPAQHTTQTMPAAALSMNSQAVPTLTSPSGTTSGTVKSKVWETVTMVLASQTSKQIQNSTEPPRLSKTTQSPDAGRTSTSQITSKRTSSFTSTSGLTATHTETASITTSIKHEEKISTSTKSVPGDKTQLPLSATSVTYSFKKDSQTGKVVAAIIGSALSLMIAGFLLICICKQTLNKQPKTTTWAGPSPLLEGECNNGNAVLGSSSRISLNSFLPHRLSKRFSLLQEANEMKDITPRATLEDKPNGNTFGRTMDGNEVQEKKETAAAPEMKAGSEAKETAAVSVEETTAVN